MNNIEQRLEILEREIRRSRRFNRSLIIAVVVVAGIAGAQAKTHEGETRARETQNTAKSTKPAIDSSPDNRQSDVSDSPRGLHLPRVVANQFVLVDQHGRTRLKMDASDSGPSINMFDEQGQKRLKLGQTGDSLGLCLLDTDKTVVARFHLTNHPDQAQLEIKSAQGSSVTKASGFSVRDADEQGRLHLALLNGNRPTLGISQRGQNGPPSIELTAGGGSRSFKIHDENGHPLFSVFANEEGKSSVNMRHPNHERTFQLSNGPSDGDGPSLAFFAPAREDGSGGILPRLRLGLQNGLQAYIRIVDNAGRPRFSAPSE